jgi:hypothetical protein
VLDVEVFDAQLLSDAIAARDRLPLLKQVCRFEHRRHALQHAPGGLRLLEPDRPRMAITSADVTSATSLSPMRGKTYVTIVGDHWFRCLAFDSCSFRSSNIVSKAWRNVTILASRSSSSAI